MSSLRNRDNRLQPKYRGEWLASLSLLALIGLTVVPYAGASGSAPTVGMYLDQPFVQGSYVAEEFAADTTVTTFNSQNWNDLCSFEGATVQPLYSGTPDCKVQTTLNYGAASTTSSTPTIGGEPPSLSYGQVGSGGASIVFDAPQTYFGMWWSAGSAGNQIQLLSGSNVIASTSADDVNAALRFGGASITSLDSAIYATRFYLGPPVDWEASGTPSDFSDQDPTNTYNYVSKSTNNPSEPFVFIHFIAAPGVTFDRVDLVAPGNGFEFDNFTTSISTGIANNIPTRFVLQRQLFEPTYVDFDANGGTGALPRQYSVDNASALLNYACLPPYNDPTRCISALNNSYSTQMIGWNTAADGSGESFYYDTWPFKSYPFTESATVYAQWRNTFNFYNLSNPEVDAENIWEYAEWSEETSVANFATLTLPSPHRNNQVLEGWYSFDTQNWNLVRVGGPGESVPASTYTTWDSNIFGKWQDSPPPPPGAVDAITPEVLPVYPGASSVTLPNLPITGAETASVCLAEEDQSGNLIISSNLQFTDLSTASTSLSTSYRISAPWALLSGASRYVRVTISSSADTSCSSGTSHIVEIRQLGATRSNVIPLYLTHR